MGNIGYWAFYDCLSLENVTINSRVKTISGEAFRNCSSFTAINIPGSVETIEGQAFRGAIILQESIFPMEYRKFSLKLSESVPSLTRLQSPKA